MYVSNKVVPSRDDLILEAEHNRDAAYFWHNRAVYLENENKELKAALLEMTLEVTRLRKTLENSGMWSM